MYSWIESGQKENILVLNLAWFYVCDVNCIWNKEVWPKLKTGRNVYWTKWKTGRNGYNPKKLDRKEARAQKMDRKKAKAPKLNAL